MSDRKVKVEICKSCLKDLDLKPKKFRKHIQRELGAAGDATAEYEVEITSCLKLCPRKNIAFSLKLKEDGETKKAVRTVARGPSEDGVLAEIASLLKV